MVNVLCRLARVIVLTLPGFALFAGCAETGSRGGGPPSWATDVPDGTQIALRGLNSRTVLLALRPPYAVGPSSHMVLKQGNISGQHHGRAFRLETKPGLISGSGPGGAVEMDVWGDDVSVNAEGSWNGSIGRFRLDPEGLLVSVASSPSQVVCGRPLPASYSTAYFRRSGSGELVQSQGSWRRQNYTLEFGSRLSSWLTREETVALIMTVFSGSGWNTGNIDPTACGSMRRY